MSRYSCIIVSSVLFGCEHEGGSTVAASPRAFGMQANCAVGGVTDGGSVCRLPSCVVIVWSYASTGGRRSPAKYAARSFSWASVQGGLSPTVGSNGTRRLPLGSGAIQSSSPSSQSDPHSSSYRHWSFMCVCGRGGYSACLRNKFEHKLLRKRMYVRAFHVCGQAPFDSGGVFESSRLCVRCVFSSFCIMYLHISSAGEQITVAVFAPT